MRKWMAASFGALILLVCAGCATLDADSEHRAAEHAVEHATGLTAAALRDDATAAERTSRELLAGGITIDEAARLALLNNPRIRAAMLEIGISRADFVQSTLFSNPSLALSLRFPDGGGLANLEVALGQNLAELWLIPARRAAAQRELDRTVLSAAEQVAHAVWNVRVAYARAMRADRAVSSAGESLAIAAELVELTIARQQAGFESDIDVQLARSHKLEAENAQREARLAATVARAELLRHIGINAPPESIALTDALEESPSEPPTSEALQATANENRFDLRLAHKMVELTAARVSEERARFIKSLEIGVSMERSERPRRGDRDWLAETFYDSVQSQALTPPSLMPRDPQGSDVIIGPTIGVELPLWDQNQAQIARAERMHQRAIVLRDALLLDAAHDINIRLAQARSAGEHARFVTQQQLPAAESGLALARESYRVRQSTLLSVFEAQRSLRTARDGQLAAMESAAIALIELERAAARPLATISNHPQPTEVQR